MKVASDQEIRLSAMLTRLQSHDTHRLRLERARSTIPMMKFPGWEVIKADRSIGRVDEVYDVIVGVDKNEPLEFRAVSNGFHAWLMQRRLTCRQWFRKLYESTPKLLMP